MNKVKAPSTFHAESPIYN